MTSPRRLPVPGPVAGLAAAYVVVLGVLLLVPSSDPPTWIVERSAQLAREVGFPETLAAAERMEVLLNVAAFVPLTFFGTLLRPTLGWRDWTALAFVGSV